MENITLKEYILTEIENMACSQYIYITEDIKDAFKDFKSVVNVETLKDEDVIEDILNSFYEEKNSVGNLAYEYGVESEEIEKIIKENSYKFFEILSKKR